MRALLIAVALALALAGCGKPESGEPADPVALVQMYAEQTCKFVPTASSVAAMLAANNPAVQGAVAIAQAICAAVTRKGVTPGGNVGACSHGEVNGVCVEGEFKKLPE
jgi:putative component of membrane protein insertase Oxa1/YidC/SpoIIIJ protein YidD